MKTRPTAYIFISVIFFIWLTILLAVFFVIQKPAWASIMSGLGFLFLTISFWLLFVCASLGLGYFVLNNFPNLNQKIIFSTGMGMGLLGVLGFLCVVFGLTNKWFLFFILISFCFFTRKYISNILQDLRALYKTTIHSVKYAPRWIPIVSIILFLLTFLLALAPPIEAFDGLFYHLTVPLWWLRDGGIQLINMPHYWFPSLMEGMFLFPLAFGLDSTPQLIHLTFAVLSLSLIFGWTQSLFGSRAAWWSIAISLSMPSLPWLSAWAYTDIGLTFYSIGALFALTKCKKESTNANWLILSAVFCGFAVGIKYTVFILPIVCCLCLISWMKHDLKKLIQLLTKFSAFAFLSGGVWYLRNLIWTGNPVYPFVFGGPYWDSFRADWYSGAGSGIGLDLIELFLLPFVTTFGLRDENFFDGRMGPFYLILSPFVLFVIWNLYKNKTKQFYDMLVIFIFGFLSITVWTFGVIQTDHLMQARLLFPALLVLLPLFGKSILALESFDTSKIRFRFIFSAIMGLTIFAFCIEFAVFVFFRNPIMASIGSEPRMAYTQRFNSSYAQLLALSEKTSRDSFIYLINEPRSYGINRAVQPDPINDNLAHDFYLYSSNAELITAWKDLGYTHVMVRSFVFDSQIENWHSPARMMELRQMLIEVDSTEEYILFQIP